MVPGAAFTNDVFIHRIVARTLGKRKFTLVAAEKLFKLREKSTLLSSFILQLKSPGSSVLHRAGLPASGWQLSARTCNFVTSRPYWPATFCLVAMSTTMSIWTRVVTCHRLDGSIVFLVDAQNLPSTNLSGSLKGVIFPRPVVRPTPGYRFYTQSICVSMACNEQAMLSS